MQELWAAPLKGFTEAVFFRNFNRYFKGISGSMAPFLLTSSNPRSWAGAFAKYREMQLEGCASVPQLLSNNYDQARYFIEEFKKAGYKEVNLNFGCAVNCVISKGKGAAMLRSMCELEDFLEPLAREYSGLLSVKSRLGMFSASEIMRAVPLWNDLPLKRLILHPRTGVQKYSGLPDLVDTAKFMNLSDHPVYFSGEINGLKYFDRINQELPGLSGFFLGRGLLMNLCLAEEIQESKKVSMDEKIDRFRPFYSDFLEDLSTYIGDKKKTLSRLKGYWFYFSFHWEEQREEIFDKVKRVSSYEELKDVVSRF